MKCEIKFYCLILYAFPTQFEPALGALQALAAAINASCAFTVARSAQRAFQNRARLASVGSRLAGIGLAASVS